MPKKLTTEPEILEKEEQDVKDPISSVEKKSDKEESAVEKQEDILKEELIAENEKLRQELDAIRQQKLGGREKSTIDSAKSKKKVKIQIPRDFKHKDDLTVGLNGTMYRFQRGKTVEVDEDVAEIIERSLEQDVRTDEMITELVKEAEKNN